MARMLGRWRDAAAWFLACAALRLATPRYRKMIDGAIRCRDALGRDCPDYPAEG
jgi:hypothetical protein